MRCEVVLGVQLFDVLQQSLFAKTTRGSSQCLVTNTRCLITQ